HYRQCQDQLLRNFLQGLQIKMRPESAPAKSAHAGGTAKLESREAESDMAQSRNTQSSSAPSSAAHTPETQSSRAASPGQASSEGGDFESLPGFTFAPEFRAQFARDGITAPSAPQRLAFDP